MIYRLVWENLKHRPVRTLVSAVFIGVSVTLILTIVGLSDGTFGGMRERTKGTGADILIRPPNSTVFTLSGSMKNGDKRVALIRQMPHVSIATGTYVENRPNFESITGIHLDEFNAMSGGFTYYAGGPFQGPDDIMVDQDYARSKSLHVGDSLNLGHVWHVCGIVQSGMLSRMFTEIEPLQEINSATNEISVIYVKVDSPANIPGVLQALQNSDQYQAWDMDSFLKLVSVDNYPLVKGFTRVVIGISVVVGFLVVLLTMYTSVLERTREIGILKALGASPGYILAILLREAVLLAVIGTIAGILMTFGTKLAMDQFGPVNLTQAIVPWWWPVTLVVSLVGGLLGAIYPGMKAARQDAIEALAYD